MKDLLVNKITALLRHLGSEMTLYSLFSVFERSMSQGANEFLNNAFISL